MKTHQTNEGIVALLQQLVVQNDDLAREVASLKAQLSAAGGHPGNDRQHAVVRRWTAPQEGSYAIHSTLIHQPEAGDGIRAFICHSGRGLLRSTRLHHATEELNVEALPMQQGDTVDFIVDINEGLNSDQFLWSPKVAAVPASAEAGATDAVRSETWDALKDFTGSAAQPLNGSMRNQPPRCALTFAVSAMTLPFGSFTSYSTTEPLNFPCRPIRRPGTGSTIFILKHVTGKKFSVPKAIQGGAASRFATFLWRLGRLFRI